VKLFYRIFSEEGGYVKKMKKGKKSWVLHSLSMELMSLFNHWPAKVQKFVCFEMLWGGTFQTNQSFQDILLLFFSRGHLDSSSYSFKSHHSIIYHVQAPSKPVLKKHFKTTARI
jgi:hypothetical protein